MWFMVENTTYHQHSPHQLQVIDIRSEHGEGARTPCG